MKVAPTAAYVEDLPTDDTADEVSSHQFGSEPGEISCQYLLHEMEVLWSYFKQ